MPSLFNDVKNAPFDPQFWILKPMSKVIEVALGIAIGIGLYGWLTWKVGDFNPADFGLGINTKSFVAQFDGGQISSFADEIPAVEKSLRKFKAKGLKVALWMGASQIHSINQPQAGDVLAVVFANQHAQARQAKLRYVQVSEPNANYHELWAVLHHFVNAPEARRPDMVVLGFTYDDLRELGIRPKLVEYYQAAPLDATAIQEKTNNDAIVETSDTPQARLEEFLVAQLETVFPPFAKRDVIRSYFEAHAKLRLVQLLFSVTKRPPEHIAAERIEWNEQALQAIFELAREHNLPLLVYKAPHRPGMKPFHHPRDEYDAYHDRLQANLREFKNAHYVDLETLIPAQYWGLNSAGQPDVFHFRVEGHRALGKAIDNAVRDLHP